MKWDEKNVREMLEEVRDEYLDDLAEVELQYQKKMNRRSIHRRKAWIYGAAAACLVVVGAAGTYLISQRNRQHDKQQIIENTQESTGQNVADVKPTVQFGESAETTSQDVLSEETMGTDADAIRCISPAQEYPQMSKYGTADYALWREDLITQTSQRENYMDDGKLAENLSSFFTVSMDTFLNKQDGKNKICSPANIYMSLALMAEITDGDVREQLLQVMGVSQIEDLRRQASGIWNANYRDDGVAACVLANSLWLDQTTSIEQEILERLSGIYYTSTYRGTMGSEEIDREIGQWINSQTGNLLQEQASQIQTQECTMLEMVSTVYMQAQWSNVFSTDDTSEGTFYADAGEQTALFMNQRYMGNYFDEDGFTATYLPLDDIGNFWIFMPEEGARPEELLQNARVQELLLAADRNDLGDLWEINISMPKFDLCSQMDLREGFETMGITKAFDEGCSPIVVNKADHVVRVAIDEEGCTAASYVNLGFDGTVMAKGQVDFTVNRPFLFVIMSDEMIPLFAGVINMV